MLTQHILRAAGKTLECGGHRRFLSFFSPSQPSQPGKEKTEKKKRKRW
jgi:hypothetical protein